MVGRKGMDGGSSGGVHVFQFETEMRGPVKLILDI